MLKKLTFDVNDVFHILVSSKINPSLDRNKMVPTCVTVSQKYLAESGLYVYIAHDCRGVDYFIQADNKGIYEMMVVDTDDLMEI